MHGFSVHVVHVLYYCGGGKRRDVQRDKMWQASEHGGDDKEILFRSQYKANMNVGPDYKVVIHQPCVSLDLVSEIVELIEGGFVTDRRQVGALKVVLVVFDIGGGHY